MFCEVNYMKNYKLEFNLFEKSKKINFNSELANKIKFLPNRFESNNKLFMDDSNIYIDCISILGWHKGEENFGKGYFKDLCFNILKMGYNIIVITPMGFVMNSILKRYGFRKYITDSDNPYEESITIMYFTQEMNKLPKIYSGIFGYEENRKKNQFVSILYDENKEILGHIYTDIGDNYDIAYDTIHKRIDKLLFENNQRNPKKLKEEFMRKFPNGYVLRFLIKIENRNFLEEWLDKKVDINKRF